MPRNGIDISSYQKGLDLSKVPHDFAIIKATEGTSIVQPTCDPWVQQEISLGKKWGFYHFLAGGDPVAEAEFFVKNTSSYFGKGLPVLDYEMYGRAVGTAGAKRFLDRVYELTKVRPIVYTSRSVLTEEDWSAIAPYYGLWVAQYASNDTTGYQDSPWFPDGSIGAFSAVCIHQYSSAGRLSGWSGNLDLDRCYLSDEQWDAYVVGDREQSPSHKKELPESLKGYVDVDPDAWYVESLEKAVERGYIKGYDASHMGPEDSLTRGQAVCIIANAYGAKFEHPFSDVVASPFYYDAVEWAKKQGIVNGDMSEFRPNDPCTREQFANMLCNAEGGKPVGTPSGYPDWSQVSEWARDGVAWAIERGIIGSNGSIRPGDPTTRAEGVTMLVRLKG